MLEKKLVPVLRFAEFDGEWIKDNLQALCKKPISYGIVQTGDNIEDGVPCVRVVDLTSSNLDIKSMIKTSVKIHRSYMKTILEVNEILMALRGHIGLVKLVDDELKGVNITRGIARLSAKEDVVSPFFLNWVMQSEKSLKCINGKVNGSALKEIPLGGLRKVLIYFSKSIKEQQKIASFLTEVDTKLSQLTKKKALLENYKKGVMQQIFRQEIRFKDGDGNAYGNWEEKKYKDIYTFYSTNSLSREKLNYESGDVKNIHYGDIHTKFLTLFKLDNEIVPFINDDIDLSKIKDSSYLQEGDLLIADASEDYKDIGKTIEVVDLSNQKVITGLHTFHARPNKHKMAKGFAGYMLQIWEVRSQVMKIAQGTKVLGLATSRLGEVELSIPCLEEQTKIANFLSELDTKIEVLSKSIENTQSFKKGLLQQMFV
jgi:type I restriction enzyme S subunit